MSYVSVQHLQKNYAGTTVFSDINCEIRKASSSPCSAPPVAASPPCCAASPG
jgi:hypothetical protein